MYVKCAIFKWNRYLSVKSTNGAYELSKQLLPHASWVYVLSLSHIYLHFCSRPYWPWQGKDIVQCTSIIYIIRWYEWYSIIHLFIGWFMVQKSTVQQHCGVEAIWWWYPILLIWYSNRNSNNNNNIIIQHTSSHWLNILSHMSVVP